MAMSIVRQYKISSDETPLIVAFWPSTKPILSCDRIIKSETPQRLEGIVGARYLLSIQLDKPSQCLVIHEVIRGLNTGKTVEGTLKVPIVSLEMPIFQNSAGRGSYCIKISFTLREGKSLISKNFKWHTKGTWSNMTARALQMWKYDEWSSDTRTIEITLPSAPKNAYEMKGDMERALGLPVNKAPLSRLTNLPTNTRSAQSLFGTTQETPRAGISRIPFRSSQEMLEEENEIRQSKNKLMIESNRRQRDEVEANLEARFKAERDAAINLSLLSLPVLPSPATSVFPFIPTLEKDPPTCGITNAYQSIPLMHPDAMYPFEQLRLADCNSGLNIGDLGKARPIRSLLTEQKYREEHGVKPNNDASKLQNELVANEASCLPKQIQFTAQPKLIDRLQKEVGTLGANYRESLDQSKASQNKIQNLEERITSETHSHEAMAMSTIQSSSRSLYVRYFEGASMNIFEVSEDIFDVNDQDKILDVTPIGNQNSQNSLKIVFEGHDVAAEVLKNVKLRIEDLYADRDYAPEVGYLTDEIEVLNEDTATQTEASDTETQLGQNAALTARYQSLESELAYLVAGRDTERVQTAKDVEKLQTENEALRQQLQIATATPPVLPTDGSSFDLLGLDFSQDATMDSIPAITTNFPARSQPDWFSKYFPNTGTSSPTSESQDQSATIKALVQTPTTAFKVATKATLASTTTVTPAPLDPDMILRIDDAVDAVGEVQKLALKAGKRVAVQITEPDEIPQWLEQVNRRIVIDSAGVVRAVM